MGRQRYQCDDGYALLRMLYPLGLLCVLRALGKPIWLLLLAAPLTYNRAFFWGFVPFQMSVGLALAAIAALCMPRPSQQNRWALGLLATLSALCHLYGAALVALFAGLWFLCQPSRATALRLAPATPAWVILLSWLWLGQNTPGKGTVVFGPSTFERLASLEDAVLGGYRGGWEELSLLICAGLATTLGLGRAPLTRRRAQSLSPTELALWGTFAANAVLYLIMPLHVSQAGFIYFRHLVIASLMVPALCCGTKRPGRLTIGITRSLAAMAVATAWWHLVQFDREARTFSPLVAKVAAAPRVVGLIFERTGEVAKVPVYHHFAAYLQADKGGFVSESFARFWNIPVAFRPELQRRPAIINPAPRPNLFDDRQSGGFFDHVLARIPPTMRSPPEPTPAFPFRLIAASGPWRLYRRAGLGQSSVTQPQPR